MKTITGSMIAIAVVIAGAAHADGIKNQGDAFNAGKEFANSAKTGASNQVNSTTGSQNLPYYGTSAPESAHYQGGRHLVGGAGTQKQIACQTYRATTAFQQQECDAVNFMSKNPTRRPKFKIDQNRDPLLSNAKGVIDSPGDVPGRVRQNCHVETVTIPGTYITETCTESQTLETVKCRRAYSAHVEDRVIDTVLVDVDVGPVPRWKAGTFLQSFFVRGRPNGFRLTWYQVHKYGQLWVNGTKVYDNLPGWDGDMRGGTTQIQVGSGPRGVRYMGRNGALLGWLDADGCNPGCSGLSPNIDITPYIREGFNEVTLVCANPEGSGPCHARIEGSGTQLTMLGVLVDNECSPLEERTK